MACRMAGPQHLCRPLPALRSAVPPCSLPRSTVHNAPRGPPQPTAGVSAHPTPRCRVANSGPAHAQPSSTATNRKVPQYCTNLPNPLVLYRHSQPSAAVTNPPRMQPSATRYSCCPSKPPHFMNRPSTLHHELRYPRGHPLDASCPRVTARWQLPSRRTPAESWHPPDKCSRGLGGGLSRARQGLFSWFASHPPIKKRCDPCPAQSAHSNGVAQCTRMCTSGASEEAFQTCCMPSSDFLCLWAPHPVSDSQERRFFFWCRQCNPPRRQYKRTKGNANQR